MIAKVVLWKKYNLPDPASGTRWVANRKKKVLDAIDKGYVDEAWVLKTYSISPEELGEWRAGLKSHGKDGLKTTKRPRKT